MIDITENIKRLYDLYSQKMHVIEDLKLVVSVQLGFGQVTFEKWIQDTDYKVTRLSELGTWDDVEKWIKDYKWLFIIKDTMNAYYSSLNHIIHESPILPDGTNATFLRSSILKLKNESSNELEFYHNMLNVFLYDYWSGECHSRLLSYRIPFWLKELSGEEVDIHTIDIDNFYKSFGKLVDYKFVKQNKLDKDEKKVLDKILKTYNFNQLQTRFLLDTITFEKNLRQYEIKDIKEIL
tara:strand:- start:4342 stop:5052 length:711 start_codon:yes stop_codon:yes gene_type:complete